MATETKKRHYRKRLRAAQEAETRQRITEAAMKLHGSIGPAQTTVKAVAEEAGVQRATVYRHFPTEESLFAACSAHWYSLNPPPDPGGWAIADPDERLRVGLGQLYLWYGWAEPMLTNTTRDAPLVPAMRNAATGRARFMEAIVDALIRGRPERGRRRKRVAAAIGHATEFTTWRSLVREQGLADDEAAELMLGLVAAAGTGNARGGRRPG
jgi:AcrR family transcriptional regulator